MRDVARLAGVSTSTVSAVIHGTAHVSPEKTKIQEAMLALDYHPDAIARSLKLVDLTQLELLRQILRMLFILEVIRGAEEAAHAAPRRDVPNCATGTRYTGGNAVAHIKS